MMDKLIKADLEARGYCPICRWGKVDAGYGMRCVNPNCLEYRELEDDDDDLFEGSE